MAEQTAVADELKNCGGCKKPVKKAKKYYRNGKYYCTKNCWKKTKAAPKEEPQKA